MSTSGHEFYDENEAEEILQMALAKSPTSGAITRERLEQTAAELGISPEALIEAEKTWKAQKTDAEEFALYQQDRRRAFQSHLFTFIAVNLFLFAINALTGFDTLWFLYPLLGWGIGMAIHSMTYFTHQNSRQGEFIEWKRKQQIAQIAPVPMLAVPNPDQILYDMVRMEQLAGRVPIGKLMCIKMLRDRSGVGLKEAKESVDRFASAYPGLLL